MLNGIPSSKDIVSPENRLIIRPDEVVSKNFIFVFITLSSKHEKITRELLKLLLIKRNERIIHKISIVKTINIIVFMNPPLITNI